MIGLKQGIEVGVCGSDLFMNKIEQNLQTQSGIRVRWLGNTLSEAALEIKMLSPAAIVFEIRDSDDLQVAAAIILWDNPEVRLLGIESNGESVTIYSGKKTTVSSAEELAKVISE